MAHTNQQRKRIRQDAKRYAANSALRSRISTFVKKFDEALKSGNKDGIAVAFKAVMSEQAKAVNKGALNAHAAGRKMSRLAARIRGVQGEAK
jgi:small subunit ribosomal protein S20